ncbi:putative MFS transporter [Aspergillus ibericus CBS 121593]|uniref:MFS transporter n=1 Tax=Aspergillus ibericus CBS 121593 TaxID=1448316 RepID=A0A395H4U8_9EURO|nr:MFS transporter [Aspergillus ibericus CBS 121593]RAL02509.1 MFS transporter [Aspergillus ibericus CBS 121593]
MSSTATITTTESSSLHLSAENVRLPTPQEAPRSLLQQVLVISQLFAVTLTASVIHGLVIAGLPTITKDLQLPASLSLWPSSRLPRWVELVGSLASGALMIGQGLAQNGIELVIMRALQGVGLSLHLASSVSIVTQLMPHGRGRNLAFSCIGLSQPLGFSLGLVVGGILIDTIGWRAGWYISGGITLFFTVIGLWSLPKSPAHQSADVLRNVRTKIDWVGAGLASAFMALLCYLLAILSADTSRIKTAESIIILCLAAVALLSFVAWVHYQSKRNKPALIPNALWRNTSFTSICATVALSNGVLNSMELFASLFFQEVQSLSALSASIRILPSLIIGILINLIIGFFVHRIPASYIVFVTSLLGAGAPLLMAIIHPSTTYWANAFVAQLLQPINADALFTVGLIVITNVFPDDTQALAGAVFNTSAHFGTALGLAVLQVISTVITEREEGRGKAEVKALMDGYQASFWIMFGIMVLCTGVGVWGLRGTGRVGLKRD